MNYFTPFILLILLMNAFISIAQNLQSSKAKSPISNAADAYLSLVRDYTLVDFEPPSDRENLQKEEHISALPIFSQISSGAIVTNTRINSGSSWTDYNEDGFMDILVMCASGNNQLYKNNGDGTFTLDTGIVSNDGGNSSAAIWGDYDNDGDLDVYVSNNPTAAQPAQVNFLYQNSGAPNFTFTKITSEAPVIDANYTWSSSWVDYDSDGDLDLHMPENKHIGIDYFYENSGTPDGNGNYFVSIAPTFITAVPESTGVASWMDYDNDGDQDLFLFKSGRTLPAGREDARMYHNNMIETGMLSFQRVVTAEMVNHFDLDFQASWGDYDNDGDMDVYLGNFDNRNYLYRNEGDSLFTRITQGDAVTENATTLGSSWGDYDNDGDLDLYVNSTGQTSRYYQNDGAGNLTRQNVLVVGPPAINIANCQSTCSADYDNDGYLDIFVANGFNGGQGSPDYLYQNNGGVNGYLLLTCKGTASNRSGIGTKVRLKSTINGKSVWQMRVVSGGPTGDRGQNALRVHFGLGNASIIDSLVVEWTSGLKEVFIDVQPNQICTVTEGEPNDCLLSLSTLNLPAFIGSFDILPNPVTNGEINIYYELIQSGLVTFTLFDIKGRKLQVQDALSEAPFQMKVADIPTGIYYMQLKTEQGSVTRKVLIR